MKQNKEKLFKNIKFERKRLIISGIYILLSLCFFTAYAWISEDYKYTRQFMAFFGYAFIVIFLISLKKLFTPEIRAELYRIVGQGILGFVAKINIIKKKIKKTLGIKDREVLYSDDEKRIILRENIKKRKNTKSISQRRFSSLTDNRERLRFIYARYIISVRKNGKSCNHCNTPEELKKTIATSEKESELFELYTPVRYSRDIAPTPEQIKEQYDYFSGRIKLR